MSFAKKCGLKRLAIKNRLQSNIVNTDINGDKGATTVLLRRSYYSTEVNILCQSV